MKQFALKLLLAGFISVILLLPAAIRLDSGHFDPFYTRFTTPKAPSLIIGTSKAAQGLQPVVFKDLAPQIQNFAFTLSHSPYGPAYLDLIRKKLDTRSKEGLFILSVDPWAVSVFSEEEAEEKNFRENKGFTANIRLVNANPNIEYMLRFMQEPLYTVFTQDKEYMKLHRDGWLQMNISADSASVHSKTKAMIQLYQQYLQIASIHPVRLKALEETIQLLKNHGKVFLVRMPVSEEIAVIERRYAPGFSKQMQNMANAHGVYYLDYFEASGQYQTTDGLHLYKEAGLLFSQKVMADIARHY